MDFCRKLLETISNREIKRICGNLRDADFLEIFLKVFRYGLVGGDILYGI